MNDKYKNYLVDLGFLVKERALESKVTKQGEQKDSSNYIYETGRLMAFNEMISIMQQQAEGFEIELSELNLEGIEPDRDLI